jgi:hypothetical protein
MTYPNGNESKKNPAADVVHTPTGGRTSPTKRGPIEQAELRKTSSQPLTHTTDIQGQPVVPLNSPLFLSHMHIFFFVVASVSVVTQSRRGAETSTPPLSRQPPR